MFPRWCSIQTSKVWSNMIKQKFDRCSGLEVGPLGMAASGQQSGHQLIMGLLGFQIYLLYILFSHCISYVLLSDYDGHLMRVTLRKLKLRRYREASLGEYEQSTHTKRNQSMDECIWRCMCLLGLGTGKALDGFAGNINKLWQLDIISQ